MKRVTIKVEIDDRAYPLSGQQIAAAMDDALDGITAAIEMAFPDRYEVGREIDVTFKVEDD